MEWLAILIIALGAAYFWGALPVKPQEGWGAEACGAVLALLAALALASVIFGLIACPSC